ncbi:MAG: Ig-like domain-containing protein, partial [Lachnospiraceae bacterium]|nr:Ig-like domain-containing protein [Lachnospiraceae bacterium]
VTLKKGKKFQIKAKAVKRGKKAKAHRKMSYESADPTIATVSKKGKVTAKKKGTTTIYCYAADGTYKKLKVKVKAK